MKLSEFIEKTGWQCCTDVVDKEQEVSGGFSGDLLSWVMGHGQPNQVWITVQAHINIIAVAVLREFSCIVIVEGAEIPEDTLIRANEEKVTVLKTTGSAFEAARQCIELGL